MIETIQQVISLFKAHWVEVLAALGAIDVLLGIITKLTPVKWDDNVYAIIHGWIAKLAVKK